MARYSAGAQKTVKEVMHKRKKGHAQERQREEGHEPQASDCDWVVRGAKEGQESAGQEILSSN